ncbi:MAG: ABC transporter permease [Clostridia bacterium]|nr:ABC transporter permease [Clostridia bacterium]
MFKVISAELKKMVSKPGIYILSCLLAIVLVMGVLIYKPTIYEDTNYTLVGNTFTEKYNGYIQNGRKLEADAYVANATKSVNSYFINGSNYSDKVASQLRLFEESYDDYYRCIVNGASETTIASFKASMIDYLDALNSTIIKGIEQIKQGSFTILATSANYSNYTSTYSAIYKLFNTASDIEKICEEYTSKYQEQFLNSINSLIFPTLNEQFVARYTSRANSRLVEIETRLADIHNHVITLQASVIADPSLDLDRATKAEMDRLSNLYTDTAKNYANLVKYELLNNAFSAVDIGTELNLIYMSDYDSYNTSNNLMKYDYLFANNEIENQFARPLTIGVSSNPETNAYDYAYFVLRVFSFIIIVYAVMCGCHAISGEIKEGSMRYLAIRPMTRTSLFFGKILSIIIMSLILILFSAIIAISVGGFVYGFETLEILTIFNGSAIIKLHPIGMLAIYLFSFLLELIVYLSLSMLIATLIKSDLFAVTIVLVLYLLNILLPLFIVGPNTWLGFYPFSHISLYSLFGSSLYLVDNNPFASLLGSKVYATSNIGLTILVIIFIVAVCNIIASKIFKRKEL